MLNLHATVRGAIASVNPDQEITYRASTGYDALPGGVQDPTYATDVTVGAQVQPLSREDLKHPVMANMQGVTRAVYMFGNAQGVVRPDAKGGDILLFPQDRGGTAQTWLVVAVIETWGPDTTGWCKVGVVLQVDTLA